MPRHWRVQRVVPAGYRISFTVRRRHPLPGGYLLFYAGSRGIARAFRAAGAPISGRSAAVSSRSLPASRPSGSAGMPVEPTDASIPVLRHVRRRGVRCRPRSRPGRRASSHRRVWAQSSDRRPLRWIRPAGPHELRSSEFLSRWSFDPTESAGYVRNGRPTLSGCLTERSGQAGQPGQPRAAPAVAASAWRRQRGGIRRAPSSRMTSPLSIPLSTM